MSDEPTLGEARAEAMEDLQASQMEDLETLRLLGGGMAEPEAA